MALVALGVSGGIGAYKAVEVARGLEKRGHEVVAVMTRHARRFVTPLTFEAITHRPVVTSQWERGANARIEHVDLASTIALLLVAPATANILGKFANGIADDFLSTLFLATKAPVAVAPSMNTNMLEHPAVQQNLKILAGRGVHIIEPGAGYLACGTVGKGRLAEPEAIVEVADRLIRPTRTLDGRRVLVTAGPTYEDIDPVRYIGNRSSGRMGLALAAEAASRGANVCLVCGPTSLPMPAGVEVVRIRRAEEMRDAVMARADDVDVVVMAAAVADYQPVRTASQKVHKTDGALSIELDRTPDILLALGERRQTRRRLAPVLIGFAAETGDAVEGARRKLATKHADMIVANDVTRPGAGFDVDTNIVTMVGPDWENALPLQTKAAVAGSIWDRIEVVLRERPGSTGS
jgi:phosphopantothenoylcysteine decarboxylase / phosphopantothenate---cysteine ligase